MTTMQLVGVILFTCALVHTFVIAGLSEHANTC